MFVIGLFVLVITVFVVIVVRSVKRGVSLNDSPDFISLMQSMSSPDMSSWARVINARRLENHAGESSSIHHFKTFELPDGQRIELLIGDPRIADQLLIGDVGTVKWRGNLFTNFQPETLR